MIIECGEGTLTGLLRHLPSLYKEKEHFTDSDKLSPLDVQLSHVNFLWISHSHLDHYGDVAIVVQAIANAKRKSRRSDLLLLIAPSRVLKYLNILLHHSPANASRNNNQRLYIGVTHCDFQHSPFAEHTRSSVYEYKLPLPTYENVQHKPKKENIKQHYTPFASLQNVEVEHCQEAFALILQMNIPSKNREPGCAQSSFVLCFSGDTRPSAQLVHACRSYYPSQWNPPSPTVSLLIHEATFINDSQGQRDAARKRHSTTAEALNIAQQIKAESCILTHFSQRYKHVSIKDASSNQNSYSFSWGVALDGMMIPLSKRALSSLFRLSQCVDAFMASLELSDKG